MPPVKWCRGTRFVVEERRKKLGGAGPEERGAGDQSEGNDQSDGAGKSEGADNNNKDRLTFHGAAGMGRRGSGRGAGTLEPFLLCKSNPDPNWLLGLLFRVEGYCS